MSSPAADATPSSGAPRSCAEALFLRPLARLLSWRSSRSSGRSRCGGRRDLGEPAACCRRAMARLSALPWRASHCAFSASRLSPASMSLGARSIRVCRCDPASSSIPRDCPWCSAEWFCTVASLLPGTLPAGRTRSESLLIHCLDVDQPVVAELADGRGSFQRGVGRGRGHE